MKNDPNTSLEAVKHGMQERGLWEHNLGVPKWSGKRTPRKGLLRSESGTPRARSVWEQEAFWSQGREGTGLQEKDKSDTFKSPKMQVSGLEHRGQGMSVTR